MPLGDLIAKPELLRRYCGDRDVVYLNLPHNPTGAVLTAPLLDHLVDLVRRRDLVVIYDAVYDAFDFSPDPIPTPVWLALESPRFAIVQSMSKNYGRPGDRIGWIVGHADLVNRLLPRLEWECVAVSAAAQVMAATALAAGNDRLVEVVRAGRAVLRRDARAVPPGGTQCWWDLRLADVEAFADFALWEHGLVLATGANYFPFADGHIRFPTGIAEPRIRAGLERVAAATRAWAAHAGAAATGSVRAADPTYASSPQ
jgi:beta-methylarginine biosynthesis bifunctional aminotransferase